MSSSSSTSPWLAQTGEWLRNKFFAGLFVVIPIAATAWIIKVLYNLVNGPFDQVIHLLIANDSLPMSDYFKQHHDGTIPGAGFVLTLLLILLIGLLAGNFFGRQVLAALDQVLIRIPLINAIYSAFKQAIDALKSAGGEAGKPKFSQVAYIPLPGSEANLIGFVTGEFVNPRGILCSQVFVPSSPAPYTGFLLIVANDKLIKADLSVEQAMKSVISLGLVVPSFAATTPSNPALKPTDTTQTG